MLSGGNQCKPQQQPVCPQRSSERGTRGCCCLLLSSFPSLLPAGPSASFQVLFLPPILSPVSPWATQPYCVVLVCFGVCTHPGWEGDREGAGDPRSCWVTLCWCFLSQLCAGSRARTAGAAPSPGDAPAHPAGQGEPARQVLAMSPLSLLPGSHVPCCCCWESFSWEHPSCHGALGVLCPPQWGQGPALWLLSDLGPCLVLSLCTHVHTYSRKGWEAWLPGEF